MAPQATSTLEVQPFSREAEHLRGFVHAGRPGERRLHHRALEVVHRGDHRLVDADDDLTGVEDALRRRDGTSRGVQGVLACSDEAVARP